MIIDTENFKTIKGQVARYGTALNFAQKSSFLQKQIKICT